MAISASKKTDRIPFLSSKSVEASRLRRRKYSLARQFHLPADLLGGSMVLSHRRCGKSSCWCAEGEGHPLWTLTYSVEGEKRIESIPQDLVEQLMPLLEAGKAYRAAVAELRSINAQLLRLWRLEQREKKARAKSRKKAPRG